MNEIKSDTLDKRTIEQILGSTCELNFKGILVFLERGIFV